MLLALDTATSRVAVGLHDGSRTVGEASTDAAMRHGESLAPLVREVLEGTDVALPDITRIAVGVGPGPFTGLRVGLVTARTLGFTLGVPVVGVCSLDVLAAEAVEDGLDEFAVATDARRKEVYFARYAAGRRVAGPIVTKPADVATDLPVLGEGAVLYPESFPAGREPRLPGGGVLARVAAEESVELLPVEPLYLRRPDTMAPRPPKQVS